MNQMHKAWTGGSQPRPINEISEEECFYAMKLFHQQMEAWRSFWGDEPSEGTQRLFFNRARGDAHATFNQQ